MISVSINIDGNSVMARSAVNIKELHNGHCVYEVDDGSEIVHDPDDGAVELAHKLLDQIDEVEDTV